MKRYKLIEDLLIDIYGEDAFIYPKEVAEELYQKIAEGGQGWTNFEFAGRRITINEGYSEPFVDEEIDDEGYCRYLDSRYYYIEEGKGGDI